MSLTRYGRHIRPRRFNGTNDSDPEILPRYNLPGPDSYRRHGAARFIPQPQLQSVIFWDHSLLTSLLKVLLIQQASKTVQSLNNHEPRLLEAPNHSSSAPPPRETQGMENSTQPIVNSTNGSETGSLPGTPTGMKFVDRYKESFNRRKKELLTHLERILPPDGSDSSTILVCWGENNCCEIFPVQIALSADRPGTWKAIREAWYQRRGSWRKHIPMFGVRGVDMVKISILGDRRGRKTQSEYSGVYGRLDDELEKEEKDLEETIARGLPEVDSYMDDSCRLDCQTGNPCHGVYCNGEEWHCSTCPVENFYCAKRRRLRLTLRSAFLRAFLEPEFAGESSLLDYELTMTQLDILRKLDELQDFYRPMRLELYDIEFFGLLVREGWEFDSQHVILPLTATLLLTLIVISRIIYGDWSTAWTFGGFLVSFITLIWMWARHAVG
ncbi:hypothetical protein F5Y06DRAFT_213949 [Hypoxylon sp. FL0890]|nr:hypothetical protein F5Y06DRAFT_213949 [Hypoxylon sp. FL0890]